MQIWPLHIVYSLHLEPRFIVIKLHHWKQQLEGFLKNGQFKQSYMVTNLSEIKNC